MGEHKTRLSVCAYVETKKWMSILLIFIQPARISTDGKILREILKSTRVAYTK
jgi:hypothetical protein